MEGKRLLIVSFDAVGSEELAYLGDDAYFRRIASGGTIFDKTRSITVSNTYPVHASISTGRMPGMHG
ncbi:MAG: alkaline phosphatase family protein, partial [Sphaerochaetaceae bacterium]|nr:alkaline phosphatase family protein [Sphaerochaetaceae bacterium]